MKILSGPVEGQPVVSGGLAGLKTNETARP
jgi:hypothetical protein